MERYCLEAKSRGIILSAPADIRLLRCDPTVLHNKIEFAAKQGCEFILLVYPDNADEMQGFF